MSQTTTTNSRDLFDRIGTYFQQNFDYSITGSITVHRALVAFCGSLNLAVLLQILVWYDHNLADENGEFSVTASQLADKTTNSMYWTYKGLSILQDSGVLELSRVGRYGKNPKARSVWRFDFNKLVGLLETYLSDPCEENQLYLADRGLDDADDGYDPDAFFFTIPSAHEQMSDPDQAFSGEWEVVVKWAARYKELRHAPETVKHVSWIISDVTGGEDREGLNPAGLSAGRWILEAEKLYAACNGNMKALRAGITRAWARAEEKGQKHFYIYPAAFLRDVKAAVSEARKPKRKRGKRGKGEIERGVVQPADDAFEQGISYEEMLRLQQGEG